MNNRYHPFGLTDEELAALTEQEFDELNAKTLFVRDAMPGAWEDIAREFHQAAESIWNESSNSLRVEGWFQTGIDGETRLVEIKKYAPLLRVWVLLAGFAIENLIKGLLIAQDPDLINTGKLKGIGSHAIVRLAEQIKGLTLTEEEKQVCKVFQEAIPYWGRYPIPKDFRGLRTQVVPDEVFRKTYLQLYERLASMLYELTKDGWESGVGPAMLEFQSVEHDDKIDIAKLVPWVDEEE